MVHNKKNTPLQKNIFKIRCRRNITHNHFINDTFLTKPPNNTQYTALAGCLAAGYHFREQGADSYTIIQFHKIYLPSERKPEIANAFRVGRSSPHARRDIASFWGFRSEELPSASPGRRLWL